MMYGAHSTWTWVEALAFWIAFVAVVVSVTLFLTCPRKHRD